MKYIAGVVLCLLCLLPEAKAGTIVLEGRYQQKNIYVINDVASEGVGYCVFEVSVNGDVTSDEINSNAFEIDLSVFGLKLGDDVVISIKHKDGCNPRVLNPGALMPQPSFDVVSIDVGIDGMLSWSTVNEQGALPFYVQQFKWNKWVTVGEVLGKGTSIKNDYRFQTTEISGTNKFRVIQKSAEGRERSSDSVEYSSDKAALTFMYDRRTSALTFSAETNYELYNEFGQILKRGFGTVVDLTNLSRGTYYVSFDKETEPFERK